MSSPYFNFLGFEEDPSSRYLDLYSRFAASPGTDFSQFLDPRDPDLLAYQQRSTQPTGSEELISDYVSRRPVYDPSRGRRLAAATIAALTTGDSGDIGRGYSLGQSVLRQPYERQSEEWKSEGAGISSRARLLDAERQRELAGMKYGLTTKAAGLRAKSTDEAKRMAASRALAGGVKAEEDKERVEATRAEEVAFRQNLAQQIFEFRQNQENWNKQQDVERNTRAQETAKRAEEAAADREADRKLRAPGLLINAEDDASELAYRRAASNPAFKGLIEFDESTERWEFTEPDSERTRLLKMYIDSIRKKYMSGELR